MRDKTQDLEALARFYREAPIGLCAFDEKLRFTQINKWMAAMNGVSVEEHLGRPIGKVVPEVAAGVEAELRHVLETGEPIIGGTVHAATAADPQTKRTFQHYYFAIRSDTGRVVEVGCVVEDVTERKRAEAAQREGEERLSAILNNAIDGMVTIDEQGIVETFNPAAERLFGYAAAEVVGRNVNMLMPAPDRTRHDEYISRYLQTGEAKIIGIGREVVARRKDDTSFPLQLGIGEFRRGGRRYFIATLHDLTARKHFDARLRQAEKMEALGRLAGGIAHDFNNILLPIITITEVTKDDLPADGQLAANLDKVLMAGQRGRSLVEQILKFSRRQPVDRRPVDVATVVAEALALADISVPETIKIRSNLDPGIGKILADSGQIHEVILNLASNAAHAIGIKNGVIEVTLQRVIIKASDHAEQLDLSPGVYVRLTMSDTGSGMDAATMESVFEPFFTTKSVGEGTGLGLAAAHGIVTEHGGAITVSSQPGHGTAFEIYLPLLEADDGASY